MLVRINVAVVAVSIFLCGCGSKESADPVKQSFDQLQSNRKTTAYVAAMDRQMRVLGQALEVYRKEVGSYPKSSEGLQALMVAPQQLTDPKKWRGPYLESIPSDIWDNPYTYEATATGYRLISAGANGKPEGGKGDDLVFDGENP